MPNSIGRDDGDEFTSDGVRQEVRRSLYILCLLLSCVLYTFFPCSLSLLPPPHSIPLPYLFPWNEICYVLTSLLLCLILSLVSFSLSHMPCASTYQPYPTYNPYKPIKLDTPCPCASTYQPYPTYNPYKSTKLNTLCPFPYEPYPPYNLHKLIWLYTPYAFLSSSYPPHNPYKLLKIYVFVYFTLLVSFQYTITPIHLQQQMVSVFPMFLMFLRLIHWIFASKTLYGRTCSYPTTITYCLNITHGQNCISNTHRDPAERSTRLLLGLPLHTRIIQYFTVSTVSPRFLITQQIHSVLLKLSICSGQSKFLYVSPRFALLYASLPLRPHILRYIYPCPILFACPTLHMLPLQSTPAFFLTLHAYIHIPSLYNILPFLCSTLPSPRPLYPCMHSSVHTSPLYLRLHPYRLIHTPFPLWKILLSNHNSVYLDGHLYSSSVTLWKSLTLPQWINTAYTTRTKNICRYTLHYTVLSHGSAILYFLPYKTSTNDTNLSFAVILHNGHTQTHPMTEHCATLKTKLMPIPCIMYLFTSKSLLPSPWGLLQSISSSLMLSNCLTVYLTCCIFIHLTFVNTNETYSTPCIFHTSKDQIQIWRVQTPFLCTARTTFWSSCLAGSPQLSIGTRSPRFWEKPVFLLYSMSLSVPGLSLISSKLLRNTFCLVHHTQHPITYISKLCSKTYTLPTQTTLLYTLPQLLTTKHLYCHNFPIHLSLRYNYVPSKNLWCYFPWSSDAEIGSLSPSVVTQFRALGSSSTLNSPRLYHTDDEDSDGTLSVSSKRQRVTRMLGNEDELLQGTIGSFSPTLSDYEHDELDDFVVDGDTHTTEDEMNWEVMTIEVLCGKQLRESV